MEEIADWLEKLGMSEYAQRFAENRIDFSVLRDLTEQDLKDLGVVLGDRRKMLRAIGELEPPAVAATATAIKPTPQDTSASFGDWNTPHLDLSYSFSNYLVATAWF